MFLTLRANSQKTEAARARSADPCPQYLFTFHLGFVHPLRDVASPIPSINAFHCLLSTSFLFQAVPSFLVMSSCHLLLGRPLDLFPLFGCHSVQRLVHLLSFILAVCTAYFHFCFGLYFIMSLIFVLFLISEHGTLSCSFKFSFFLPIDHLIGLVVKASASRAGFKHRLWSGKFCGSSHTSELKIGTPVANPAGRLAV